MRIDITSLCFGFKIEKENDSGTPAWATSIGQAPKDICYVDTKIEGLSEFIYGMMYKSHSDFDNLKDCLSEVYGRASENDIILLIGAQGMDPAESILKDII